MYFMKVLYAEHLKSKRTILKKIPFVLAFVIVGFILFVFRSSDKNEIVMNSGNYWITISDCAYLNWDFGWNYRRARTRSRELSNYKKKYAQGNELSRKSYVFDRYIDFFCCILYVIIIC